MINYIYIYIKKIFTHKKKKEPIRIKFIKKKISLLTNTFLNKLIYSFLKQLLEKFFRIFVRKKKFLYEVYMQIL